MQKSNVKNLYAYYIVDIRKLLKQSMLHVSHTRIFSHANCASEPSSCLVERRIHTTSLYTSSHST